MNYTLRFIHKHTDTYTYNYTCPIYNSTVSPATPPPVGAGGCPAAGCSRWAKIWADSHWDL